MVFVKQIPFFVISCPYHLLGTVERLQINILRLGQRRGYFLFFFLGLYCSNLSVCVLGENFLDEHPRTADYILSYLLAMETILGRNLLAEWGHDRLLLDKLFVEQNVHNFFIIHLLLPKNWASFWLCLRIQVVKSGRKRGDWHFVTVLAVKSLAALASLRSALRSVARSWRVLLTYKLNVNFVARI